MISKMIKSKIKVGPDLTKQTKKPEKITIVKKICLSYEKL
jgi:hypothetical protein